MNALWDVDIRTLMVMEPDQEPSVEMSEESATISSDDRDPPLFSCFGFEGQGCGYSIPMVVGTVCPECGHQVQNADLEVVELRARWLESAHAQRSRMWLIRLAVVVVYGMCGGTILNYLESPYQSMLSQVFDGIGYSLLAMVGLGIGVVGSWGVGILLPRVFEKDPEDRKLYQSVWTSMFHWFHAQWVLIGPCTILGLFLSSIEPEIAFPVCLTLFVAWIICLFVFLVWGLMNVFELLGSLMLRSNTMIRGGFVVWSIVVTIGCTIVGFYGGVLGTSFIFELVDYNFI